LDDWILPYTIDYHTSVYEIFPGNYAWSQAALRAMFVGGSPGDVLHAAKRLTRGHGDPESWHEAWKALAERLEARGVHQAADGHHISAASSLRRASIYHQWSVAFLSPKDPRRREIHERSVDLFGRSGALAPPHATRIEVPYEASTYPAWLVMPPSGSPAPCVIYLPGWDSTKEQGSAVADALADRGIATLLCDGPGIGEAVLFRGLVNRYDYEVPGRAALDRLSAEDGIDPSRIAVIGSSLGGYRAARFAAFEPRLRAAVIWGAIWDFGRAWRRQLERPGSALPTTEEHALFVMGARDLDEVTRELDRWILRDVAGRIACPLLILHGERDSQFSVEDAERLHEAAGSERKLLRVFREDEGGSAHCQNDNRVLAHEEIADWLADELTR
jgi:dienelactone hydrolase